MMVINPLTFFIACEDKIFGVYINYTYLLTFVPLSSAPLCTTTAELCANFSKRNEKPLVRVSKPFTVNFKCLDTLTFTLDASNHILKNLKTDAGGIRTSVIESETDSV